MTTRAPYHTTSLHYTAEERNVHHDDNACWTGKRIKPEHQAAGTAGCPLCKDCAKL